jgi:hypothetical protein
MTLHVGDNWISHTKFSERLERSNAVQSTFVVYLRSGWTSAVTCVDVRKNQIGHSIRDNCKSRLMSQLLKLARWIKRSEQEWLMAQQIFYFYVIVIYAYLRSKCKKKKIMAVMWKSNVRCNGEWSVRRNMCTYRNLLWWNIQQKRLCVLYNRRESVPVLH